MGAASCSKSPRPAGMPIARMAVCRLLRARGARGFDRRSGSGSDPGVPFELASAFAERRDRESSRRRRLPFDRKLTHAALILLGARKALGRFLQQGGLRVLQCGPFDRAPLWNAIDLCNEVVQYQDGLSRRDVPVMNEVVSARLLNAVARRDCRLPGMLELVAPRGRSPKSPGPMRIR